MQMDVLTLLLPLILVAAYLMFAFRIAKEDERFVVTVLGRFRKLKGPGLLLRLPGSSDRWHRLTLGELGNYSGDGVARFGEAAVPVKFNDTPTHGVRIDRFDGDDIWVSPAKVMSVRCEKCGHHNHVSV